MIPFTCPKCGTELEVPNSQAGKKVACPDCGTCVLVKPPAQKAPGGAGSVSRRPAAKGPAGSTTRRTPGKAPPRPDARPKRRPRDDEDDEDEAPRPRKGKKGSSAGLWVGLGVGGGVAVLAGAVVVVVVLMSGKGKDEKVATAPPPVMPVPAAMSGVPGMSGMSGMPGMPGTSGMPGASNTPPTGAAANTPPAAGAGQETKRAEPPADDPLPAGGASDEKIYKYLLKATALVILPVPGGYGLGTGSVIDKTNRLILTNYHVVGDSPTVLVLFPGYDANGRLITNREAFLEHAKGSDALTGKVVARDPHVDLALVQVDKVPDGARALPFAAHEPGPGTHVISMGHPGSSGSLWVLTTGTVKQLMSKFRWQSTDEQHTHLLDCNADVVLTDSQTNPGDSGGPLVNNRGELVAVVHGANSRARGLSLFIDITEVNAMVQGYAKTSGVQLALAERSALADEEDSENVPKLLRALDHKDATKRAEAARDLGAMGPGAQVAVPRLVKLLNDADDVVRQVSLEALHKIGKPAAGDLPALLDAVKGTNPQARLYAAGALGDMGPDARRGVGPLLPLLQDKDPALRRTAARALGQVGSDAREQVQPALLAALKDGDPEVRAAAGDALASLPLGPSDAPVLVGLLKHQDAEVRASAARALGKSNADAKAALKPLAEALKDGSGQVRQAALESMTRYGADAKDYVPDMTEALRDSDPRVKRAACVALAAVGPDAKGASHRLADALADLDVRKDAVAALIRIGPAAAHDAVPKLVGLLSASSADDRLLGLTALAELKPPASEVKELVPKLISAFEERDARLRDQAALTLGQMGRPAVPALTIALGHPTPTVRLGAAKALGAMGAAAGPARNALNLHVQVDPDPKVREACATALTAMQQR